MAKWNISSDAITVEQSQGRSPSRWLRQNGLRIAVVVGRIEAVLAYVSGHALLMTVIGSTAELGTILFQKFLLPFEILSLLLLVAMVGVILLSKKDLK